MPTKKKTKTKIKNPRAAKAKVKPIMGAWHAGESPNDFAAKFPNLPARAHTLMASAAHRKLNPAERGELRGLRIKKDGSPIATTHERRASMTAASIGTLLAFGKLEALVNAYQTHGAGIRKPLAKHLAGMPEGADKDALTALAASWFPRKAGGRPFVKREAGYRVGKNGRVALNVAAIAKPGDRVDTEIETYDDGVTVLIVVKLDPAAPVMVEGVTRTDA